VSIRVAAQLQAALDRNLSWRKRELSSLYFVLSTSREGQDSVLTRGSLVMLYAHWEGFVKDACDAYGEYLENQSQPLARWVDGITATILRRLIKKAGNSNQAKDWIELISNIRENESDEDRIVRFSRSNIPGSKSNLNGSNTRNIFDALSLDFSQIALKEQPVIERVVELRHMIAHGRGVPVSSGEYYRLHTEVILLLDTVKECLLDAVVQKSYLR